MLIYLLFLNFLRKSQVIIIQVAKFSNVIFIGATTFAQTLNDKIMNKMKYFLVIVFLKFQFAIFGQGVFNIFEAFSGGITEYRLGAGYSMAFQNKNPNPFHGIHFSIESEYGFLFRCKYFFKQRREIETGVFTGVAMDTAIAPQSVAIPYRYWEATNILNFEIGGKWHFLNEEPDYGISMYAGFLTGLSFGSGRYGHNLDSYDSYNYVPTDSILDSYATKKINVGLSLGALIGAQYGFDNGDAIYLDLNPEFTLWMNDHKYTMARPFLFSVTIGYRFIEWF